MQWRILPQTILKKHLPQKWHPQTLHDEISHSEVTKGEYFKWVSWMSLHSKQYTRSTGQIFLGVSNVKWKRGTFFTWSYEYVCSMHDNWRNIWSVINTIYNMSPQMLPHRKRVPTWTEWTFFLTQKKGGGKKTHWPWQSPRLLDLEPLVTNPIRSNEWTEKFQVSIKCSLLYLLSK